MQNVPPKQYPPQASRHRSSDYNSISHYNNLTHYFYEQEKFRRRGLSAVFVYCVIICSYNPCNALIHYMLGGIYLYCLRVVRVAYSTCNINTYENDREKMYIQNKI